MIFTYFKLALDKSVNTFHFLPRLIAKLLAYKEFTRYQSRNPAVFVCMYDVLRLVIIVDFCGESCSECIIIPLGRRHRSV